MARSQPGELSQEFLAKRQQLHQNLEYESMDISIKKKKMTPNQIP